MVKTCGWFNGMDDADARSCVCVAVQNKQPNRASGSWGVDGFCVYGLWIHDVEPEISERECERRLLG